MRSLVRPLAADGTTVLLSTHLLAEVEQICTHVGVMHVGRLVAQGSLRRAAPDRRRPGRGWRPTTPSAAAAGCCASSA